MRVARDETAATTLAMLADCFDTLGGVPAKVLADRMGCLKGGTIANVVIPTPDYVRFATHYRFVPDFCHPADPESKGIVENLVGYAKTDLVLPDSDDLAVLNDACRVWCCEVNARAHSEICAIPDVRLVEERALLRELPMLRPRIGRGGPQGRQAVHDPSRAGSLLGPTPTRRRTRRGRHLRRQGSHLRPRRRPRCRSRAARTRRSSRARRALPDTTTRPSRGPRARTDAEREFLALGEPAEAFIRQGAAAGMTMLPKEIIEIVDDILPAHGPELVAKALARAARFGRFRAADVRSILAIGTATTEPAQPGDHVVVGLPTAEVRSFDAYRIENLA